MYQQILTKFPNNKFNENTYSGSRDVIDGQTHDEAKRCFFTTCLCERAKYQ
jgi:hypothetical protein